MAVSESGELAPKKKKKKSVAEAQKELRDLARPTGDPDKPPVDTKKLFVRIGGVLAVIWVTALVLSRWSVIPVAGAGVLTAAGIGIAVWVVRYTNKARALGALLRSASETEEGRQ